MPSNKIIRTIRSALTTLGIILAILLGVAYSCTVLDIVPGYAHVIVDDSTKLYHSPRHRFFEGRLEANPTLRVITLDEAKIAEFKKDRDCEEEFERSESLLANILRKYGILQERKRVNPDGTWTSF